MYSSARLQTRGMPHTPMMGSSSYNLGINASERNTRLTNEWGNLLGGSNGVKSELRTTLPGLPYRAYVIGNIILYLNISSTFATWCSNRHILRTSSILSMLPTRRFPTGYLPFGTVRPKTCLHRLPFS